MKLIIQNNRIAGTATEDYTGPDEFITAPEDFLGGRVVIRNTDPVTGMKVVSARYYNTDGKLLREFLPKPQAIPPLGTYELYVPRSDSSGGSGANFVIDWTAEKPINPPLVEALHADIREARTLIFVTTGRYIQAR